MTGGPTVVVVDDAPAVRLLVATRLRFADFEVVGSGATGRDAVALAEQHQPDLMVLDVSMPDMDGLEALQQVRKVSPRTKVVIYTGFEEAGLAQRAHELGAAALIEKASPVDELAGRLREVLVTLGEGSEDAAVRLTPGVPEGAQAPGTSAPGSASPQPDDRVLSEHLERFREVFEQAAIGMATMTLAGRIVRANRALAELMGRSHDAMVGLGYGELLLAPGPERLRVALDDLVSGRADVSQVESFVNWEGVSALSEAPQLTPLRVLTTVSAVRDVQQRPLYLLLQVQDVTAQRAAEEAYRRSEERFRLLIDAVEDYAIFMLDPSGRVASWNLGAQRINGYTEEEILGQHLHVFYPPELQDSGHVERELQTAATEGHYEEEGWRVRKDGTRFWAHVVLTAIRGQSGELLGYAKVTRDITERRNDLTARKRALEEQQAAAQALAEANRELETANERLGQAAADQSRFLAVTAHELRTPIGVLAGFAQTLNDHWTELTGEERAEMLASMSTSAGRLRRLLADLLTASRLEAGAVPINPRPVNVRDLLLRAAASVRSSHPEAAVEVDAPDNLEVLAEPDRLAQAVDNLVANALRHGAPPVTLAADRHGETVQIRVSDNGDGVPAQMRSRLFQRFATGESAQGTGLGLYISRELLRAHGGDAWYSAADGQPPAFVLSLPVRT